MCDLTSSFSVWSTDVSLAAVNPIKVFGWHCCWTIERLVLIVGSIKVIVITASLIAIEHVRISLRLFGSDKCGQAARSHTVKKKHWITGFG